MPIRVAGALLAVLLQSCATPPPSAAEQEPPLKPAPAVPGRISVPEAEVDLGDVERGDRASHVFVLKNGSDGVVRITKVWGG